MRFLHALFLLHGRAGSTSEYASWRGTILMLWLNELMTYIYVHAYMFYIYHAQICDIWSQNNSRNNRPFVSVQLLVVWLQTTSILLHADWRQQTCLLQQVTVAM